MLAVMTPSNVSKILKKKKSPTYELKRSSLFDQLCQRVLHDAGGPLVYLVLVIVYSANYVFNTLTTRHISV